MDIDTLYDFRNYWLNDNSDNVGNVILRNGWIDERYMQHGICRIGNKRLKYDADYNVVIETIDLTRAARIIKGINRKKVRLSLDPEFYSAINGVVNKSRFISDAILSYRGNVDNYSSQILRIKSNPDYIFLTIKISQQAQDILQNVASKHQYIRDAVMAYQKYKEQYI